MLYQSALMREICDMYGVPAFALRRHIIRNNQDSSNWALIRRFCRQELSGYNVDELYHMYYMASHVRNWCYPHTHTTSINSIGSIENRITMQSVLATLSTQQNQFDFPNQIVSVVWRMNDVTIFYLFVHLLSLFSFRTVVVSWCICDVCIEIFGRCTPYENDHDNLYQQWYDKPLSRLGESVTPVNTPIDDHHQNQW